jgi:protein TonB
MWIRILMAGFASVATMGGLYALLFGLVKATTEAPETIVTQKIDFTRLKMDSQVATNRPTKPERKPTETQPNTPQIAISAANIATSGPALSIDKIAVGEGIQLGKMDVSGMGGVDREVIPLVRIQPQYPPRAAARGIEGWVRCQFNITPAGGVVDAVVTDSEPRGMFDRAALEAVSRWKYNPKVEGGVAVERRGVQVLLTFQLEK